MSRKQPTPKRPRRRAADDGRTIVLFIPHDAPPTNTHEDLTNLALTLLKARKHN